MKENKLIAEFMDVNLIEGQLGEYHISWDWLMPVVQKIGDDYYNTPFDETLSNLTERCMRIYGHCKIYMVQ